MPSDARTTIREPYLEEIDFEAMAGPREKGVGNYRARCVDISGGGLGLVANYKPEVGQVLKMGIPFKSTVRLPVFAEVMWTKAQADGYRTGVRFLS